MGGSLMSGGQKKYSFNSGDAAKALREFEMRQAGYNPNMPFDAPNLFDLGKNNVTGPGTPFTSSGYGTTEPYYYPLNLTNPNGAPYGTNFRF